MWRSGLLGTRSSTRCDSNNMHQYAMSPNLLYETSDRSAKLDRKAQPLPGVICAADLGQRTDGSGPRLPTKSV